MAHDQSLIIVSLLEPKVTVFFPPQELTSLACSFKFVLENLIW